MKSLLFEGSNEPQLPSIPPDTVRRTHFTSERVAQIVLGGSDYKLKHNDLNSTTDGFSNNEDVINLIKSGKTGAFTRSGFGTFVILMDIPNDYDKVYRSIHSKSDVPNELIIGVVNRNNMIFTPNKNYNPKKVKPPVVKMQGRKIGDTTGNAPTPQPTPSSNNVDVW